MPVTRSRHEAGRIATTPPSPSNDRRPRPCITMQDLAAGCIVWLPSRAEDDDSNIKCIREPCCSNRELQDGGYDHPVVVLKVSMNSLGDTVCAIAEVTSKQHNRRSDRIRISQGGPVQQISGDDETGPELYLEKGAMDKQSYVVLRHIFQLPASQLRLCSFKRASRAYDLRVCEGSYKLLMGMLQLEPERWIPTNALEDSRASPREPLHHSNPSREQPRTSEHSLASPREPGYHSNPSREQPRTSEHSLASPREPGYHSNPYREQSSAFEPVAANTNAVFSSPYQYNEDSDLLTNYTVLRAREVRLQRPVRRNYRLDNHIESRRLHQQDLSQNELYYEDARHAWRRQREEEFLRRYNDGEGAKFPWKSLIVLLGVGSFVWWRWTSKQRSGNSKSMTICNYLSHLGRLVLGLVGLNSSDRCLAWRYHFESSFSMLSANIKPLLSHGLRWLPAFQMDEQMLARYRDLLGAFRVPCWTTFLE